MIKSKDQEVLYEVGIFLFPNLDLKSVIDSCFGHKFFGESNKST